jgi:thiol-disulfide isomerase/thioredoxin
MPARLPLVALDRATGWINSEPLTATYLRGNVVVIDFWTYTCINWLRSLPYVRAWSEHYADHGLVTIGVHTPEFEFERRRENVERAAHDLGVSYPVALDTDYAIWRGFSNHYWPALYLLDARGQIRDQHFGEGDYDASETVIRRLLTDAGATVPSRPAPVVARGVETPADWDNLQSQETYLGSQRAERFTASDDATPLRLGLNRWALSGAWTRTEDAVVLDKADGKIFYRFHARDLHLVMAPGPTGRYVRFRVLIDGQPPGIDHGLDVDEQGRGLLESPRLYQLIRQRNRVDSRTVEIAFLDPGARAYVFTFG